MTLAYFKQLEQLLLAQIKRLDIIKRLKQKAPVHESFKLQLTQEIKEYLRNTNSLKQRINRYSGKTKTDLFGNNKDYDDDNNKKDDDDMGDNTQTGLNDQVVVPKKKNFNKAQ